MELNNPLYKNIGAHVVSSIFTIEKGEIKVLLIKRKNEPFKGKWALPGGAMYNNELIIDAAKRELKEKTNLQDIDLHFIGLDDTIDRSPIRRMFAFIFIGLVDIDKVESSFIEDVCSMQDDMRELNTIYNMVRNFCTKNPIKKNVYPLSFNKSSCLSSFDYDKFMDGISLSSILRKDGR